MLPVTSDRHSSTTARPHGWHLLTIFRLLTIPYVETDTSILPERTDAVYLSCTIRSIYFTHHAFTTLVDIRLRGSILDFMYTTSAVVLEAASSCLYQPKWIFYLRVSYMINIEDRPMLILPNRRSHLQTCSHRYKIGPAVKQLPRLVLVTGLALGFRFFTIPSSVTVPIMVRSG